MSLLSGVVVRAIDGLTDRRPSVQRKRCSRHLNALARCDACRQSCPSQSIDFASGAPEVADSCDGCDACVGVCPQQALTRPEQSDLDLLGAMASAFIDGRLRLRCSRAADPAGLPLSCLGRLNAALLVHCAAGGISTVELDMRACSECSRARALGHLSRDIELAGFLAAGLGSRLKVERMTLASGEAPNEPRPRLGRRGLLSLLRPVAQRGSQATRSLALAPDLRQSLVLLFTTRLESPLEPLPSNWPFGAVTIDQERCDGCPVCAATCPAGALSREVQPDAVRLHFDATKCTHCGECRAVCRRGALTLEPARLDQVARGPGLVAEVRSHRCRLCGRLGAKTSSQPCPLCASGRMRGTVRA